LLVAVLLVAHVCVTALTWHDLQARSQTQVRGPKQLWKVLSALNMSNSAAYWLFARKHDSTLHLVPPD
jgi:hypothetical protein